jgi:predicted ATPase/GNAT superfamily N-acetyltransferase
VTGTIAVEHLPRDALWRLAEIDRSEDVHRHYRQHGTELTSEPVVDRVPDFRAEGAFHSIPSLVLEWQPDLDGGGVLLGAFVDDRLAGMAMLGMDVAERTPQLSILFVGRPYRRSGVANALMDEIEAIARERGAEAIYVSAVPSDSAVGFYVSRGFRPTEPLPEPFAKEPDDIHMRLVLTASRSFVLTGAPGSGKSAIMDRLHGAFDLVTEPAREILAEQRATGGAGTAEQDAALFVELLRVRSIERFAAASRAGGVTLFDRGIPDCVAYAVALGVDAAACVDAARTHRYHDTVLILEPWEAIYTTDDERRMSFADTIPFHRALVAAYEDAGYSLIAVPRATIDERAAFVRGFVGERSRRPAEHPMSPRWRSGLIMEHEEDGR